MVRQNLLVCPGVMAERDGYRRPVEGALQRLPLGILHGLLSVPTPADGIAVSPHGCKKPVGWVVRVALDEIFGEYAHGRQSDGYGRFILQLACDRDDIPLTQIHLARDDRGAGELEYGGRVHMLPLEVIRQIPRFIRSIFRRNAAQTLVEHLAAMAINTIV